MPKPDFTIPQNAQAGELEKAAQSASAYLSSTVYAPVFAKVAAERGLPCNSPEELDQLLELSAMLEQRDVTKRASVVKTAHEKLAKEMGIKSTTKVAAAAPKRPAIAPGLIADLVKEASTRQDIVNAVALRTGVLV